MEGDIASAIMETTGVSLTVMVAAGLLWLVPMMLCLRYTLSAYSAAKSHRETDFARLERIKARDQRVVAIRKKWKKKRLLADVADLGLESERYDARVPIENLVWKVIAQLRQCTIVGRCPR